jgi:molybdopterin-guanine dinucleotide biosynthesis protein A
MTMLIGAILAGGRSRRMGGGDKFLLKLDGERLIDRVVRRLAGQVDRLVVNVNGNAQVLAGLGLPLVEDVSGLAGLGPLSGILAAVRWAEQSFGRETLVLTVPADVPFLPLDLAARLAGAMPQDRTAIAAIASSNGQLQYTVALWRAAAADDIEAWLSQGAGSAIRDYVAARHVTAVEFAGAPDPFLNINRPEDLERARVIASTLPS